MNITATRPAFFPCRKEGSSNTFLVNANSVDTIELGKFIKMDGKGDYATILTTKNGNIYKLSTDERDHFDVKNYSGINYLV